jgi:hypothetical protein
VADAAVAARSERATRLCNELGYHPHLTADYAGARARYEQVLAIDEAAFGPTHPTVARDANNLGGVLQALGDYAGARARFEQALRICEARLGPDHPYTRTIRDNLRALDQLRSQSQ